MTPDQRFQAFGYLWMAIGLSATAYFWFGKNAEQKRLYFRHFTSAATGIFIIGGVWIGLAWWQVLIALPIAGAIGWHNLHTQRFCSNCARPVNEQREPLIIGLCECCHRCHAPLEPRHPPDP